MAASGVPTRQYTSEEFVESCGAILFNLQQPVRVCLIRHGNEWLLAKGRRNVGETRQEAALREVKEETGYDCCVYPVGMSTRAPPAAGLLDHHHISDQARYHHNLSEPFMLTVREIDGRSSAKLIWWYIAVAAGDGPAAEADYTADFFTLNEAIQKLTFRSDREVLERAIQLTFPCRFQNEGEIAIN
ncbi:uncharacterized protein GIQ15_06541 [Arthroderma uncinatum]|uniref:uncharacterized protein n=1 Tax=Arthroderma uncinatum TaxID=74035 RepID=UPI00144AF7D0|nr:uncharacterized protein GIQ15_06541 [Arthroderma uncinatum]KAF3479565.1 hypothetical protein GIQ15_06541 [Arthroderma uncinatum]